MTLSFASLVAIASTGCGDDDNPGRTGDVYVEITIDTVGEATGHVLAPGGQRCLEGSCTYIERLEEEATFTAVPGAGSVFLEWLGDCSGSDPAYTFGWTGPQTHRCTAVFVTDDTPSEVRDAGMVRSHRNCTLTSDEPVTFDCSTLGPYGMADVWVPSAADAAQFGRPNEDCYTWVETDGQIPSQDLGDITLATSLVTGTATHDGFGYQVTGIPLEGDPFAPTDELSVTTSAGTVTTPTPPAPRIVTLGFAVLTLTNDADQATAWTWQAAGYTSGGDFAAAVCRFAAATELEVTPDPAVEALLSIDLFPNIVYAGPTSTAEVESGDQGTLRFDATRTLGFTGTDLAAAGELDELE